MTRSAVSRQIKTLEEFLGKALFERDKTHLKLTEEGLQYSNALSLIFSDLKISTDQVMGLNNQNALTLNLYATVNATWLMRRLPEFEKNAPKQPSTSLQIAAIQGKNLSTSATKRWMWPFA